MNLTFVVVKLTQQRFFEKMGLILSAATLGTYTLLLLFESFEVKFE